MKNFYLYLARSPNGLNHWENVVLLERRGSQGKVWVDPVGDHILLAFEESPDGIYTGNNIKVNHYENLDQLKLGIPKSSLAINRTLSGVNEGTPSFVNVQFNGDLLTSNFTLRMHYFETQATDKQAIGRYEGKKEIQPLTYWQQTFGLRPESKWMTYKLTQVNQQITDLGFKGNIGSRHRFQWRGKTFYLLEAQ